jgi:hypothetical protein
MPFQIYESLWFVHRRSRRHSQSAEDYLISDGAQELIYADLREEHGLVVIAHIPSQRLQEGIYTFSRILVH